jgi:hypothetical protein
MSIAVEESFEAIEAKVNEARAALEDEHEGRLRIAVAEMKREVDALFELVTTW